MPHDPNTLLLVADIGGTNTRVALADGSQIIPESARKFRNADYPNLDMVLRQFLTDEGGVDIKGACIAVAGPVQDGKATLTNLPWTIDETTVTRATQAQTVAILNDLQAQGHALGHLDPDNIQPVLRGEAAAKSATKLVVGVGTGFNATPVFETPLGRIAAASESGHVSLPTRTEQDLRLAAFVARAHGFPSVEDVLSGRGLENVYAFLSHEAGTHSARGAAEIMAAVASRADPIAMQTAAVFVKILGAACGNLALTQLPFGGIYLVGGVSRAIGPYLIQQGFADAFADKGRFSGFMSAFSVSVITDDFAALTGSAIYLVQQMENSNRSLSN